MVRAHFHSLHIAPILFALAACGESTTEPQLTTDPDLFMSVATGTAHTCGITGDSTLYCWGLNSSGQLGDGTSNSRLVPAAVAGNRRYRSVTAQDNHTCAVAADGAAYCWGDEYAGKLGVGPVDSHLTVPTAVASDVEFSSIVTATTYTCALSLNGAAYCWGENAYGQLGDGSIDNRAVPVAVTGQLTFSSLTVGASHTCAVEQGGTSRCWGSNGGGELGAATTELCTVLDTLPCSTTPLAVEGAPLLSHITAGSGYTCGVSQAGQGYCWGDGALGTDPGIATATPTQIAGDLILGSASAGPFHCCGLTIDGEAYCWGENAWGRLGDGTWDDRLTPTRVATDVRFKTMISGYRHTCAVSLAGVVYCWGSNDNGQLGDGSGALGWSTPVALKGW